MSCDLSENHHSPPVSYFILRINPFGEGPSVTAASSGIARRVLLY